MNATAADLNIDQGRAGDLGLVVETFTGTTICSGCGRTIRTAKGETTARHVRWHRRWCRDCAAVITNVRSHHVFEHRDGGLHAITQVRKRDWLVYFVPLDDAGKPMGDMRRRDCDLGDLPKRVKTLVLPDAKRNDLRRMAQGRVLSKLAVELKEHHDDLTSSQDGQPEDPGLNFLLMDLKAMYERIARLGSERERGLL